ncbi:DUF6221 family protein [Micromonospora sp. MED01]|uniref:DUF6221 family protein n=1 Tax=Micromonospora alfalfae TaxID=2911212 RepID=UPI001EE8EC59|nr:DUF6221 family protein [Micromonospora alfalfae]MCG5464205.1 DUF6221 family protein [Micromonospora alfalfae]
MTDVDVSIIDFLRARYDELTASATGADGAYVYFDAIDDEARDFYLERDIPKYVLADLDSKRAILGEIELIARLSASRPLDQQTAEAIDRIGGALAAPFAAHPDYQESWRL